MGVPNRQIGWNDKTNMLWNVLRELNALRKQVKTMPTVIIGGNEWTSKNYDGRRMNDGTTIPLVDNITDWNNLTYALLPCCAYPNFDEANKDYGLLYNFNAISNPNFEPEGWRLPEYSDFSSLVGLGSYAAFCAVGMYYWNGNNGTDLYGFDARGAGYIQGFYGELKEVTAYWGKTSTPYTDSYTLYITNGFVTGISIENRDYSPAGDSYGWSVRFIKA